MSEVCMAHTPGLGRRPTMQQVQKMTADGVILGLDHDRHLLLPARL